MQWVQPAGRGKPWSQRALSIAIAAGKRRRCTNADARLVTTTAARTTTTTSSGPRSCCWPRVTAHLTSLLWYAAESSLSPYHPTVPKPALPTPAVCWRFLPQRTVPSTFTRLNLSTSQPPTGRPFTHARAIAQHITRLASLGLASSTAHTRAASMALLLAYR
jgi:hypothetical protein